MKCRILFVFMIFLVVCGMLVSPLSVLSAVSLVILHQADLSLVLCRLYHQPGHLARECRQAWGSVHPGTEVFVGDPLGPDVDSPKYGPHTDDDDASLASDDGEMASGDEEVAAKAAPPQPRPFCSAPAVSTSLFSVPVSPVSVSTSPSSASVFPALVSSVSTAPSSAPVSASPDVSSSVSAVPASSAVSSAVTSDSEPVTSVASRSSPSSVPVSRSSVVAHRDNIDSHLLSALRDFSRGDVIRMSPARITDFVSRVIENGLSVYSHQYMARFEVYTTTNWQETSSS